MRRLIEFVFKNSPDPNGVFAKVKKIVEEELRQNLNNPNIFVEVLE